MSKNLKKIFYLIVKIKFYLEGLDRIFEVEPIVIEGLNHAVNFGMEFLLQQEVSISCSEQEAKLVTGSGRQERLSRLCSATGSPFPFVNKGKRLDKVDKKYVQRLHLCWKAEKDIKEARSVNYIPEVKERKLWAGEKICIPAGSAKLVKVRVEENWRGEGFVESFEPEEQDSGRKLVLPENEYNLSESMQAVYVENHAE